MRELADGFALTGMKWSCFRGQLCMAYRLSGNWQPVRLVEFGLHQDARSAMFSVGVGYDAAGYLNSTPHGLSLYVELDKRLYKIIVQLPKEAETCSLAKI